MIGAAGSYVSTLHTVILAPGHEDNEKMMVRDMFGCLRRNTFQANL